MDEKMSDLPKGWAATNLSEVVIARKGKKPKILLSEKKDGCIPYILIDEMEGKPIRSFTNDISMPIASEKDILVVWDGSIGKIATGLKGAIGSTIAALTPFLVETTYLESFIKFSKPYIEQTSRGTGLQHINPDCFWTLQVPLAPLSEQRRIVVKLDRLLHEVNDCKERLDKVPAILKRFRQSVLAAACSGLLTEDWREKNPDIEPANMLLNHIKTKRLKEVKTSREREKIISLYEEAEDRLAQGNVECALPATWLFCEIGEIGDVCNGSTPSRTKPEYWADGIPWVSSGEVRNNIITETRETISKEGYNNSSVRMLPVGTVLLAMIGEGKTRGQTAILKLEATINQNIAAIILDHGLISSEYLWYWFQFQYELTRQVGSGSGPQALNCQRVRELFFNLPPLPEQQEIVRRVEGLFKKADEIEARYRKAKVFVDRLTQSILAKAFRGELVPQDPNDEPASVLLEKIKAEKAGLEEVKKRKKGSK
jgi:type I restriction enzyme S subunit